MENTYTEDKTICFWACGKRKGNRAKQRIYAVPWNSGRRPKGTSSVSDTDLVDYAVFEMEAARRKYMLLLKRYAEERKYGE